MGRTHLHFQPRIWVCFVRAAMAPSEGRGWPRTPWVPSLPRSRRNLPTHQRRAKLVCIHAVHVNRSKERNSAKNLEIIRRDRYLLCPQQLSFGDTGKEAGPGKAGLRVFLGWVGRGRRGSALAAAVLWKGEARTGKGEVVAGDGRGRMRHRRGLIVIGEGGG